MKTWQHAILAIIVTAITVAMGCFWSWLFSKAFHGEFLEYLVPYLAIAYGQQTFKMSRLEDSTKSRRG